MQKAQKIVNFRRKREGRTNYRKRLTLLVSNNPRLVVRKTNKNMIVQIVTYHPDGDKVVVTANSSELKKLGWTHATGNLPSAYLTGLIAGKKALEKKLKNAIVDLGLQTPLKGSRLYAAVKGARDAGLEIPCSDEVLPSDERLKGAHIASHVQKSKDIVKSFDGVKSKILGK